MKKLLLLIIILIMIITIGSGCCLLVPTSETNKEESIDTKAITTEVPTETTVKISTETTTEEITGAETVEKQRSIEDIIYYEVTDDMFMEEWVGNVKAESSDPAKMDRIKKIINLYTSMYPDGFLVKTLDRIYILSYLSTGIYEPSGLYSSALGRIYVSINPKTDKVGYTMLTEQTLHAETSSILLKDEISNAGNGTYSEYFDKEAWHAVNPEGFNYDGKSSVSDFDQALFQEGFLYPYAMQSDEEDFNSIIKNALTDSDVFWNDAVKHERIKMKLDLAVDFYIKVDSRFNEIFKHQYEKHNVEMR